MLRNTKFVVKSIILFYVAIQLIDINVADGTGTEMKIYKGLSAVGHQYLKHMVIVKGPRSYCGGSILAPKVILTAAHCISKNGSKSLIEEYKSKAYVCAGTPEFKCNSATRQKSGVKNVFVHESFKRSNNGHDVAVIILKKALVEDDKTVQRIELANHEPSIGTTCTAIGWGRIECSDLHKKRPEEAQYTFITRLSDRYCEPRGHPRLTLCFSDKNKTSAICKGDSGGALICDGKAAGISSLGAHRHHRRLSEYTSVVLFRKWIKNIIKEDNYKMRNGGVLVRAVDLCIIFVMSLLHTVHFSFYL